MTHARRITDRRCSTSMSRRTVDVLLMLATVWAFVWLYMGGWRPVKALITVAALALAGCSTLPTSTLHRELAWQSLNIADGVQTSQYVHNDCRETGTWRYITGPEPSVERTILAASINGALHFAVTWALERFDMPQGVKSAWGYTTLGLTGAQVAYNASLECAR
jgi:hypothetical protein